MNKEKFESAIKWVGGIAAILVAGTIAWAVVTSLLGIIAAMCIGLAGIHFMPVLATRLANWKYRQLRQQAIENPMPTLIRAYEAAVSRYKEKREGVNKFATTIANFKSKIESYQQRNADTTTMQTMYDNMKRAIEMQVLRLTELKSDLDEAKIVLAETQDKYNMALDMQAANNQLEDFTGESGMDFALQREAFDAVTSKLNEGFARMEISLALDYNALPASMQNTHATSFSNITTKLKELEHV